MTTRDRILVVDDEPQIQRFLRPALEASGYEVIQATTAAEAQRMVAAMQPRAIILDLGLPDADGKDVIKTIRRWTQTPIVVLTARDEETEIIAALDAGGNDYVSKPFGIGELLARLRAVLRMPTGQANMPGLLEVGGLAINIEAREVTLRGAPVHLTPKEFDLLAQLASNRGRVLTHRMLLARVWGPAHVEDSQYLRVFVGQLRSKVETDPSRPNLILTVPGVGYKLERVD